MHLDRADLPRVFQPQERPPAARVAGAVDSSTDDHVAADRRTAGADVHDVGIRFRHVNRPDRPVGNLAVADRLPALAARLGLKDAPATAAHIEGARLAAYTRDRRHASATR